MGSPGRVCLLALAATLLLAGCSYTKSTSGPGSWSAVEAAATQALNQRAAELDIRGAQLGVDTHGVADRLRGLDVRCPRRGEPKLGRRVHCPAYSGQRRSYDLAVTIETDGVKVEPTEAGNPATSEALAHTVRIARCTRRRIKELVTDPSRPGRVYGNARQFSLHRDSPLLYIEIYVYSSLAAARHDVRSIGALDAGGEQAQTVRRGQAIVDFVDHKADPYRARILECLNAR